VLGGSCIGLAVECCLRGNHCLRSVSLESWRRNDDIRASSASAPANIAEGFGRFRPLQFATFLGIAKASLVETQNHLVDASDRRYIDRTLFSRLLNLAKAAERATTNLLRSKLRQAEEEQRRHRASRARVRGAGARRNRAHRIAEPPAK
jgi:four helix bundle protein